MPGTTSPAFRTRRPGATKQRTSITTTTTTTAATSTTSSYGDEDDEDEETGDEEVLNQFGDVDKSEKYWSITCINRTFEENFKSVQKVNRNKSTIQVPIQVYKQDIAINMTAFWTESLDEQFKYNYEKDSEMFWQFFCSSNGLYRRYIQI